MGASPPSEILFGDYRDKRNADFEWEESQLEAQWASAISNNMLDEDYDEDILRGPTTVDEFDSGDIRAALEFLTPENLVLILTDSKFPDEAVPEGWTKSGTWYDGSYISGKIPDVLMQQLRLAHGSGKGPHQGLELPGKNEAMSKDFEIVGKKAAKRERELTRIPCSSQTLLWHKLDDSHMVPKLEVVVYIRTPVMSTPEKYVAGLVLCQLIIFGMAEGTWGPRSAGSSYTMTVNPTGVRIRFRGYSHKLHMLCEGNSGSHA